MKDLKIITELCKNNMNETSIVETRDLVLKIINFLKGERIANLICNESELDKIILDIRKEENIEFSVKLERTLYEQELVLKEKNLSLEKVMEYYLIDLRRFFLTMPEDICFIDFHDVFLNQLMTYLVDKNRTNPLFEKKYLDIKSSLSILIQQNYTEYMDKMAINNTNLVLPLILKNNEETLHENSIDSSDINVKPAVETSEITASKPISSDIQDVPDSLSNFRLS